MNSAIKFSNKLSAINVKWKSNSLSQKLDFIILIEILFEVMRKKEKI